MTDTQQPSTIPVYALFFFINSEDHIFIANSKVNNADLKDEHLLSEGFYNFLCKKLSLINSGECNYHNIKNRATDFKLMGYTLFDKDGFSFDEFELIKEMINNERKAGNDISKYITNSIAEIEIFNELLESN